MFRAFTAASILALTTTAAQAGPSTDASALDPRVREAVNNICGPLLHSNPTSLFYQAWYKSCMGAASIHDQARWELQAQARQEQRMLARN